MTLLFSISSGQLGKLTCTGPNNPVRQVGTPGLSHNADLKM